MAGNAIRNDSILIQHANTPFGTIKDFLEIDFDMSAHGNDSRRAWRTRLVHIA